MNVGFVSLGCSKNLLDTEMTIGLFKNNKFNIVNDPSDADVIVINTCGFIESAKEEAINTILEMAEYKQGRCKYLIAMGCLVERYKDELEKALPEVDLFIKYSEYNNIWEQIESVIGKVGEDEEDEKLDFMDRVVSTGENFAYLRIAEGCDNRCTFCAIPYIRGKYISRKFEDVIEEAKMLAKSGIKELIVIAQDTTKYGVDIYGKARLAELLNELCKIDGIKWIRFLYAYPETITDELINVVKNNDKICNYFDIPIQHISDKVLKRMNRKSDGKSIRNVVAKIRKEIPNVIIRTTVMVGFPGETNEDFDELYEFIKEAKFDRLGAFSYSKEEGTPAARIKEQVHPMTKTSRYNKIMALQQKVYEEISQKYIGKELEVLLEERSFDGKYYIARSYMDVPDIDGVIFVNCDEENLEGQFAKVKILKTQDYDLIVDTAYSNTEELADIIINGEKSYREEKEYPKFWASPVHFLPVQDPVQLNMRESGKGFTTEEICESIKENGFNPIEGEINLDEYNGQLFMGDGNHRVFAELSAGKTLLPYYSKKVKEEPINIENDTYLSELYNWADGIKYYGYKIGKNCLFEKFNVKNIIGIEKIPSAQKVLRLDSKSGDGR